MITTHRRHLEARCRERGYELSAVMPCVVKQDGDQWTIDETHPTYPKPKSRGLGDTIAKATSAIGIKPCKGCKKRQEILNKWFPYRQAVPGKIDVLIPLSTASTWENNELRFLLRSLEQNFPNLGRIFVVGHKPDWLVNVEHIPCDDLPKLGKDTNIMRKVLLACQAGISDTFLRASDDQALLREPSDLELIPCYIEDQEKFATWQRTNPKWAKRFKTTCDTLGVARCFDLHVPQIYQRDSVQHLLENTDLDKQHYTVNTWILGNTATETQKGVPPKLWYNYKEASPTVQEFLMTHFPKPSSFEKTKTSPNNEKIAVLFLTCDRLAYTKETLESFEKYNNFTDYQLYHVDDASTDPEVVKYVQSKGFKTIVQHTVRKGCSPTTEEAFKCLANLIKPGTPVLYLQNDFNCQRTFPTEQTLTLLSDPEVAYVQLSYRLPRAPHFKRVKWFQQDGTLWQYGDKSTSIVKTKMGIGLGYHPSIATIETWLAATKNVKRELHFTRRSAALGYRVARLTDPVFKHIGAQSTINGLYGKASKDRKNKRPASRNATQVGVTLCQELCKVLQPGQQTLELGSGLSTHLFLALGCNHTALEHQRRYAPNYPGVVQICKLVGNPAWYNWQPDRQYDIILVDGPPGKIGRRGVLTHIKSMVHDDTIIFVDDTNRKKDLTLAEDIAKLLDWQSTHVPAQHSLDFQKQFTIIRKQS